MRKTILCTVLPILIFAANSFAQPTAGTQLQRAITQQFRATQIFLMMMTSTMDIP